MAPGDQEYKAYVQKVNYLCKHQAKIVLNYVPVLSIAPVKYLNSQCCHTLAALLLAEDSEPIRPAHQATSHLHTATFPH